MTVVVRQDGSIAVVDTPTGARTGVFHWRHRCTIGATLCPMSFTLDDGKGFTPATTRSMLSGRADELIDLSESSVTRRLWS